MTGSISRSFGLTRPSLLLFFEFLFVTSIPKAAAVSDRRGRREVATACTLQAASSTAAWAGAHAPRTRAAGTCSAGVHLSNRALYSYASEWGSGRLGRAPEFSGTPSLAKAAAVRGLAACCRQPPQRERNHSVHVRGRWLRTQSAPV
ncbi:hypothetical protein MRX96_043662 [Rhipicephalus microplus]